MKLTLGFSPCPNDTFIFDALVNGKIDTEGLTFEVFMADVEELNRRALNRDLDITKLSCHAYGHVQDDYVVLDAGSALGRNCGPLLIAKRAYRDEEINGLTIAIPGRYTTANFLLSLAFPEAQHKRTILFSDIEQAVLNGDAEAGVIIHENRFTYQERGLVRIMDLGGYWEEETGLPIPLGGIMIKRDLPVGVKQKVNRVLKKSVEYGLAHPEGAKEFVKQHAREMDETVMYRHIGLYVNEFSVDLGEKGRAAVRIMLERGVEKGMFARGSGDLFMDEGLEVLENLC